MSEDPSLAPPPLAPPPAPAPLRAYTPDEARRYLRGYYAVMFGFLALLAAFLVGPNLTAVTTSCVRTGPGQGSCEVVKWYGPVPVTLARVLLAEVRGARADFRVHTSTMNTSGNRRTTTTSHYYHVELLTDAGPIGLSPTASSIAADARKADAAKLSAFLAGDAAEVRIHEDDRLWALLFGLPLALGVLGTLRLGRAIARVLARSAAHLRAP